jgi:Flp pilus assembly protein TadG
MPFSLSNLLASARRFFRAENANVAMIFGLAMVPITAGAGVGLDLARAMSVRTQLTTALDAAGLAAGGTTGLTQAQMQTLAQTYFNANYKADSSYGTPAAVSVSVSGSSVTLASNVTMPTTLMAAVGVTSLPINVSITVTKENKKVEVVLALDNTGSMAGTKLTSLKSAATSLVDTLSGGSANPTMVKFGLVTFTQTVRLDPTTAINGGWIDTTCKSSVASNHFDHGYCAYTVLATMNSSTKWMGCVEARPNGYEVLDTAPVVGTPDTLFEPYFQPDEPHSGWGYPSDYISDGTPKNSSGGTISNPTDEQYQENAHKYSGKSANSAVNGDCSTLQAILPLTNDVAAVKSQLSNMQANGNTHVVLGATWGWRVLSPGAPYTEGVAYSDSSTKKILVLMTDGENTVAGANNSLNKSQYSAFGYLTEGRLGTTSSTTTAEATLDTMLSTACTNIKAQGIIVYTIGFTITTTNVLNLLRNCASSPSNYYNAQDGTALASAFAAIANDISNLRVSK